MSAEYDAIVVGAGPNGLTAAATLATAGRSVLVVERSEEIGGATRSTDHGSPGWIHDMGATIHSLAAASPAYERLGLEGHGLEYLHFDIELAHVLDDARGAALCRDVDATADGLGVDGPRYARLMTPLVDRFDDLRHDVLGPLVGIPRHPVALARFGAYAALPATLLARRFRTEEARALLLGNAAHSYARLTRPLTASFALMLGTSAHAAGWPVIAGGSRALAASLRSVIESNGGEIVTGHDVTDRRALPEHGMLFLDTSPSAAASILDADLRASRRRRFRRFRHGTGAFKIDYELSEPIPWAYEAARSAGTVHVIGSPDELVAAERDVNLGAMPDRPFVLVAQASLVDPSRAPEGRHTAWTYAHVPAGYTGDATTSIERQLERFAPGFADLVLARHATGTTALEQANPNLLGGDIGGGSYSGLQAIRRPRLSPTPYRAGPPGVFLCSASTPPGAGAHGMCGHLAALDALGSTSDLA